MTILSGQTIQKLGLISPCSPRTVVERGNKTLTFGLGPAGYDLRLDWGDEDHFIRPGQSRLAATVEHFCLPSHVMGRVYNKSSWARRFLSCAITVIEPGWYGYLTLELTNLGQEILHLPPNTPIAQVIFEFLDEPTQNPYTGKYQGQQPGPQSAL